MCEIYNLIFGSQLEWKNRDSDKSPYLVIEGYEIESNHMDFYHFELVNLPSKIFSFFTCRIRRLILVNGVEFGESTRKHAITSKLNAFA